MRKTLPRGFTVLELLIIIVVIGILLVLLYPVPHSVEPGRRAQAKNDAIQIATAITAYETEYGHLPLPLGTTKMPSVDTTYDAASNGIIGPLLGTTTNNNPHKIVFMEVADVANKTGKSGLDAHGNFVDPWGNIYRVTLDYSYDNSLSVKAGSESAPDTTNTSLKKHVAVVNLETSSANKSAKDYFRHVVTSY